MPLAMRTVCGCLALLLFAAVSGRAELSLTGALRNDAAWIALDSGGHFVNLLENRWVVENRTDAWRFYGDLRVWALASPDLPLEISEAFAVRIPRAFVRYLSELGVFSLGKTYAAFGLLGVFNPFELDQSVNVADLGYVKQGLLGLTWELGLGDLSGLQAFVSPEGNSQTTAAGLGLNTHALGFDAGLVVLRRGTGQNQAGLFLKGDLEVEVQASAAWHADDQGKNGYGEAVAGLDYSLSDGEWLFGVQYAFQERAAARKTDQAASVLSGTSMFNGKQYIYGWLQYLPDQFFQARCDAFWNVEDRSSLVVPSATWVLADGLSATLLGMIPTGPGRAEFGHESLGRAALDARVEAKF
ncbi:MAG: hypothetical protein AB1439_01325 [candidate division FCPU426 bacterium]